MIIIDPKHQGHKTTIVHLSLHWNNVYSIDIWLSVKSGQFTGWNKIGSVVATEIVILVTDRNCSPVNVRGSNSLIQFLYSECAFIVEVPFTSYPKFEVITSNLTYGSVPVETYSRNWIWPRSIFIIGRVWPWNWYCTHINLNNVILWGIISICKIFAKTWHCLFCFGVR